MDIKPKILVVDDRPENLTTIRLVLKDMEVELIEATNGNDALKATLHHDFALALLDIQMPEMDGYELASILREEEKTARLPFIFISAVYTDNLNVFKGYEKGAFSFITKPFQPEMLINKVQFFIDKHQQKIALYKLNEDLINKNTELENVNRELEAFTYSVSHDLRSPLRVIDGYGNVLMDDYGSKFDAEGKRILGHIMENAQRMGHLIDALLHLSRLGRKDIELHFVDMNNLVKFILKEQSSIHFFAKSEIKIHLLEPCYCDSSLITQVWINLISNAVKYSANQSPSIVEIGSIKKETETVYYVKDNGVGFDMKYADKLFGVFQRLHKMTEFEGTGVGLAIVYRIVTKHKGRVWAEAETGKGATFYFSIPLSGYFN